MNQIINKQVDVYLKKKRKKQKIFSLLAILMFAVAISTTYALKKPAETITYDTLCHMEEHIHSDSCGGNCSKIQHIHFENCYAKENCPPELVNVFGIVEVNESSNIILDEVVVDETSDTLSMNDTLEVTPDESQDDSIDVLSDVELVVENKEIDQQKETSSSNSLNDYEYEYLNLQYNVGNGNILITDGMTVPANATIILETKVLLTVEDVKNCGGVLYYSIPQQLKNNIVSEDVTEGSTVIAHAAVDENNPNLVKIEFSQEWLDSKIVPTEPVKITFVSTSQLDTDYKDENNQIDVTLDQTVYTIQLSDDWQNEACEVEIVKSNAVPIDEEDADYLEYTLTVSIPEDSVGSPNVQVVDRYHNNIGWVSEYVGVSITPTDLTATDPSVGPVEVKEEGKTAGQVYITNLNYNSGIAQPQTSNVTANKIPQMIWTIGAMDPGETRTLTYRVKVNPKFNHVTNNNQKYIKNVAEIYSGTLLKDDSSSTYTYDMAHIASEHQKQMEYVINDDGSVLITYTINFGASSENDFTFNNIRLVDSIYTNTNAAYKPYISLVEDSMHMYAEQSEGNFVEVDFSTLNPHDATTNPVLHDDGSFTIYMGDFPPGMTKKFTYQVLVDKGVFTLSSNNVTVQNRFTSYSDNKSGGPNLKIDACNSNALNLGKKVWSRKLGDANATTDIITIHMNNTDEVYDNTYHLITSPSSYDIPSGSYKYQVVINESADFDMTDSTFTDEITDLFKYVGYVKVMAIPKSDIAIDFSSMNDTQIIEYFENNVATNNAVIKWYDIDGQSSFTFEPRDLGLTGHYAYVLTYYAKAKNMNQIQQENIVNTFNLTGIVGDYYFPTGGIYVDQSFTVVGGNNYEITKDSWYYDPPNDGNTIYPNGEMYWFFKLEGPLYEGIQILDKPDMDVANAYHTFKDKAFVGLYKGNLNDGKNINDYFNLEDFKENSGLTLLDDGDNANDEAYIGMEVGSDYRSVTFTLLKDIILEEDEAAYIIMRNEPNTSLNFNAHIDWRTYENKFYYRSHDTSNWIEGNSAQMNISTKRGGFKDTVGVYEVSQTGTTTEYTNIAKGLVAVSSCGDDNSHPISYLTDDNEGTLWVRKWQGNWHSQNYPCDVTLSLDQATYVDQIEFVLETVGRPFQFYIEVTLEDGTTKVVIDQSGLTGVLDSDRYRGDVKAKITQAKVYFVGSTQADGSNAKPIPAAKELKLLVESTTTNYEYETLYTSADRQNYVNPDEKLVKSQINESGIYVEWIVNINWDGSLNDELTMIDTLPEGIELLYLRYFDYGTDYDITAYNFEQPQIIQISDYETKEGWDKYTLSAARDSKSSQTLDCVYYYNQNLNQFVWQINNMEKGGEPYKRNAQFQVVAKVLDPDVLMSNSGLEVLNQIKIIDKNNRIIEDDSTVIVNYESLDKTLRAQNLSTLSFALDVNPSGINLDPTKDQVVLIDKMSSKMVFLEESLVIRNTLTNEVLDKSQYKISLEYLNDGTTNVRFILPDGQPFSIIYDVRINVEPNTEIAISNEVYWEGYSDENNKKYENDAFSFDLGITVEVVSKPSLTVLKKDQNDLNKGLENAKFELVAVTYENGVFTPTGTVYSATTDENGVCAFSNDEEIANRYLNYNTIYQLSEIQAPDGYILNSKPYYFVVATKVTINNQSVLPTFPSGVDVYTESPNYVYTVTNERGKIVLDKQFVNNANEIQTSFADGTFNFGIYDVENPTNQQPLQKLTIAYKNGKATYYIDDLVVSTPSFNNLNVNETYYIYEMDKDLNPIIVDETLFPLNNTAYIVHYDSTTGITIPNALNSAITKTITNEVTYELPETGGMTKEVSILFGLFFVSIALYGLKRRKVFIK